MSRPNAKVMIFRANDDASDEVAPGPNEMSVYCKMVSGAPVLFGRLPDGSVTVIGSGGGSNGPSACLRRAVYDTPGSPTADIAASFGPTAGAPTHYAADQRNSLDFDTVVWASPGMVDLTANPRRITITEDGIYEVEAFIEFDTVSEENVVNIFQNGYDTTGGHTPPTPAPNDGLEPTAGFIVSLFGFTTTGVTGILTCKKKVTAHVGDFFFVGHQSSGTYHMLLAANPGYIQWYPYFIVTKVCDIPA